MLRTAIEYLREWGACTTARVQHITDNSSAGAASHAAVQLVQVLNRLSNQCKPIICHKYGQEGHIAANCPLNHTHIARAGGVLQTTSASIC